MKTAGGSSKLPPMKISKKRKGKMDLKTSKKKKGKMDLKKSSSEEENDDIMDLIGANTKERDMIEMIVSKKKGKKGKMKKKEAVLIGLNHPDPQMNNADIKGQLLRMKDVLIKHRGFPEDNITLFIDDEDETVYIKPTELNIRLKLCSLVDFAKRGDILFIHLVAFSRCQGYILTSDNQHIPDSFFRAILMKAVRHGYHMTFVSDCLIEPAVCRCSSLMPLNAKSQEEKDKEITEFWKNMEDNPDALDTFATVDFPNLDQTKLSSVDILNPKEKKAKGNGSSRVILLMPFRDQNATTQEEEDSLDDHASHDHFSRQYPTIEEDESFEEDDFFYFPPPKKTYTYVENTTTKKEYSIDVSELFFPPPKGNTTPQHKSSYGGFTNTILNVMDETDGKVTNLELAQKAMKTLGETPGLRCSHHNHARASFVC